MNWSASNSTLPSCELNKACFRYHSLERLALVARLVFWRSVGGDTTIIWKKRMLLACRRGLGTELHEAFLVDKIRLVG